MMTRYLAVGAVVALLIGAVAAAAQPAQSKGRFGGIAKEIREEIAAVREAVAEAQPQRSNIEEICFRVGGLYLTARRELEEANAAQVNASARAKKLVSELIKDSRSLPSFCGDAEKVKNDPGYEQVKKGDVADLNRELTNMDRRATELAAE
ncbi:MAG: hypothetical protein ACJ8F1_20640 [Polyangia bacterium]